MVSQGSTSSLDVLCLLQGLDSRSPRRSDVGRYHCGDRLTIAHEVHHLAVDGSVNRLRRGAAVRR